MQPPPTQTIPVLSSLGVAVQLAGALPLIGLFFLLRRFVLRRRSYFAAWTTAWCAVAMAIAALVVRYVLIPRVVGTGLDDSSAGVRALYVVYQFGKAIGFAFFVRGALSYVAGTTNGTIAMRRLFLGAVAFTVVSTLASHHGLQEMVIWQSLIAVPAFGYCASALLWLPRPRRTAGSIATGASFALLALLWLVYAGAFGAALHGATGTVGSIGRDIVSFNAYLDLSLDILLGYSMVLLLMEDAKREVDDAQAELRVTHDQLRRAALYDALTDSLNRHAFAEGVALDMVRATFGTVILADLDNLKLTNDRYGHAAGDLLLRRCADVLRTTLRLSDKVYRWGGDEFLLIVPGAHAADVLDRFRRALDMAEPVEANAPGVQVKLQVSLGAADYASSEELSTAIERADGAMYQEKMRRKADLRLGLLSIPETPPSSLPAVG